MPVRYPRRIIALAIALGCASSPSTTTGGVVDAFAPPFAPRILHGGGRGFTTRTTTTGVDGPSRSFCRYAVARHPSARWAQQQKRGNRRGLALAQDPNLHDEVEVALAARRHNRLDGDLEEGEFAARNEIETTSPATKRGRWRSRFSSSRWSSVAGRFDTLTSSGLSDARGAPGALVAGGTGSKRLMVVFFSFLLLKWARSKFLLKNSALNEFQPNWGHVITSKEQEKNLHAWTCKECGATMFVAKGREFRFHNRFTKCFNCGAKGKDNFYDRRDEIEDDGDFQYESPVNYKMSKKEREKLEREAEEAKEGEAEVAIAEVDPGAEAEEEVVAASVGGGGGEALEVLDAEEVEEGEEESAEESSSGERQQEDVEVEAEVETVDAPTGEEAGEGEGVIAAATVTDEAPEDGGPGAAVAAKSEVLEVERGEDGAEGNAAESTGGEVSAASTEVEGATSDDAATEGADKEADGDEPRTFVVGESGDADVDVKVEGAVAGAVEDDAAGDASSSPDGAHAAAASTPSPVLQVPAPKNSAESTTTTTSSKTGPSSSPKQSPIAAKEEVGGEDGLDALGMDGF